MTALPQVSLAFTGIPSYIRASCLNRPYCKITGEEGPFAKPEILASLRVSTRPGDARPNVKLYVEKKGAERGCSMANSGKIGIDGFVCLSDSNGCVIGYTIHILIHSSVFQLLNFHHASTSLSSSRHLYSPPPSP